MMAAPLMAVGTKLTVIPSMVVSPILAALTVTMIPPLSSVATLPTYFDVGVDASKPQLPAVGKLPAEFV